MKAVYARQANRHPRGEYTIVPAWRCNNSSISCCLGILLIPVQLVGISNIFDDAYVEEHDEKSKHTVLKSGDMRINIKSLNFKAGDKVSWGIHPENITLLLADSGSEDPKNNTYSARINNIINKGPKKRITLKLIKYNKILTAEVPAQLVDSLKLHEGDLCLIKLEMSKVVAFHNS